MASGAYANLPGVKLWFVDTGGSGVPVVLLHPNTGTVEIWEPQIDAFARAGYRVIAFDRKGWGKSVAEPASGPQPGSIAGDLDALADYLKLDTFHLLGIAGGGFVALAGTLLYRGARDGAALPLLFSSGPPRLEEAYGHFALAIFRDGVLRVVTDRMSAFRVFVAPDQRAVSTSFLALASMLKHGHRGVAEIAQAIDALYAFSATADAVPGPLFDLTHAALVADEAVFAAMKEANPQATQAIVDRLQDALARGLWVTRRNSVMVP